MLRLSVVTPTGNRPRELRYLEEYLRRQTLPPFEWIVVDDGDEPSSVNATKYVRRPARAGATNTLPENLLAGLDAVEGDAVVIMEDDDWYAPDYLAVTADGLSCFQVYGEGSTPYYNIAARAYVLNKNNTHASLCATAFRLDALPIAREVAHLCAVDRNPFVDVVLWEEARRRSLSCYVAPYRGGHVGIKGGKGIGYGHRLNPHRHPSDPNGAMLRAWIGGDAERYLSHG